MLLLENANITHVFPLYKFFGNAQGIFEEHGKQSDSLDTFYLLFFERWHYIPPFAWLYLIF